MHLALALVVAIVVIGFAVFVAELVADTFSQLSQAAKEWPDERG